MAAKQDRDIEKGYSTQQMVAKLRRLADCLEQGKPFQIQIAGERVRVPAHAIFNIEPEREVGIEEVEFQFKWERLEGALFPPVRSGSEEFSVIVG